jgi:DNA-directed RNA polymerase specialized sigma24 family protein
MAREPLKSLTKRDIAILSAWDSHRNYDAMAAALELNIGTVKSRLSRARVRLARLHPDTQSEAA